PPRWPSSSTPHDQRTGLGRMPQAHAGAQARPAGRPPAARPRQSRHRLPLHRLRRLARRHHQRIQAAGAAHPLQPPAFHHENPSMTNALTTLTRTLATKLDMGDGADLVHTLKATAFKGEVTDAQMTALL